MAKRPRKRNPEPSPGEIVSIALDRLEIGDMAGCLETLREDPDVYAKTQTYVVAFLAFTIWNGLIASYMDVADVAVQPVETPIPDASFVVAQWVIRQWETVNQHTPIDEMAVGSLLQSVIDRGGWAFFPRTALTHELDMIGVGDTSQLQTFVLNLFNDSVAGFASPPEWHTLFDGEKVEYGFANEPPSFVVIDPTHRLPLIEIMEPGPRIRISYETITPGPQDDDPYEEDRGWYNEEGIEVDVEDYDEDRALRRFGQPLPDVVDDDIRLATVAVDHLITEGGLGMEPSSSAGGPGTWYTNYDANENYQTGARTSYSYHLDGFTPEQETLVFNLYRAAGRRRRLGAP